MSRIFNISVTFKRISNRAAQTFNTGPHIKPSSFAGEIVVTDEGRFFGYAEESHQSKRTSLGNISYLTGAMKEQDDLVSMAFYQLSNDRNRDANMHILPDINKTGHWASRHDGPMGRFKVQGQVKVAINEADFSPESEKRILDRFNQLSKRIGMNQELTGRLGDCEDMLENLR